MVTILKTLVLCVGPLKSAKVAKEVNLVQEEHSMNISKSGLSRKPAASPPPKTREEVRCAVRFPLGLPVVLSSGNGEFTALTRNVSASGVLFELDRELPAGLCISFTLRMPRTILGTPHDVLVHCKGRVVRCSLSQSQYLAASTIDDYQFAEQ